MITKAMLEEKLKALRQQQEEMIAQINSIGGAIMFTKQLIAELETDGTLPEEPADHV